jgi:hypothetical protein
MDLSIKNPYGIEADALALVLYLSEGSDPMPQDKKRVYRQQMLAERRHLQKALDLLEQGQPIADQERPATRDGEPMSAEQIRERIRDLERQLHIKPSEA